MKTYRVNEIFYSLQGEGMRAGTANLFLRFTGCNLTCRVETHGFDCDTEFTSGRDLTIDDILNDLRAARNALPPGPTDTASAPITADPSAASDAPRDWIILTGGEPALQVDRPLIDALHAAGYRLAIETNGSIALPEGLDWITVSPKVAEHAIRQRSADEVKYVRGYGQAVPRTVVEATHKLVSPAFAGDAVDVKALEWCIQLVKDNPDWRLSIQMHKAWRIR